MNHALMIEMAGLLHQATTEQSHYYVAATLAKAIKEIVEMEARIVRLEGQNEQLQNELLEYKRLKPAGKS